MHDFFEFITFNAPLITILAIVLVVIPTMIVFGKDAFERWLRHKEVMADALNAQAAEKAAQYAAHTERLEHRVRVLERIATDRGADLSTEIELLRAPTPTGERPLN